MQCDSNRSVQMWAEDYRAMGWAIVRISPGQKRPTDKRWTRQSCDPSAILDGFNVGIQSGRLSEDLVCLDIDSLEALAVADTYLPRTGMIEGRPGKRRSHRWYKAINIPPELTAGSHVAGGIGGPRTRLFKGPDRKILLEFRGTGSQLVVPPSVRRKGHKQERREWDSWEEPALIDCRELFEATCRLAPAFGWVDKQKSRRTKGKAERNIPELLPMPSGKAARQSRTYIAKIAPAIVGQGGDSLTFQVACVLVLDFGLNCLPLPEIPAFFDNSGSATTRRNAIL